MAATVTFPTTRPRKSDTRWIAKQKWLQIQNSGGVDDGSDQTIVYPDTQVRFHDTKLITLQKILQDQSP